MDVSEFIILCLCLMRRSRKFCQRGSKFDNFFFVFVFLVEKGIEDPNITVNGSPSARQ